MGPDMLIMPGSYRDEEHFARPICDLASAIRSANPIGRSVQSRRKLLFGQENASLRRQNYTPIALAFPDLRWRPSGLIRRTGSIVL
jgi:hypothetical protein